MLAAGLLLAALTTQAQLPMQCAVLPGPGSQASAQLPPVGNPSGPVNPTTCNDVQNIRVNVHFMQHDDGTGNFTATDDGRPGNPSTATSGYDYAQGLIWACNDQMSRNPVLQLAPGSSISPLPDKRVRWLLDGVYFHRSRFYRDGAYAGNSPSHDYAPLCAKADSVINIFLVEEIDEPYPNGNPAPTPGVHGYVYGSNQAYCNSGPASSTLWAVVSSPWTRYILANTSAYEMASAVNHELCHLLGLNHPFQGLSTCSDAPMHPNANPPVYPNCWNLDANDPNCDAWSKVSNNLMDTNAAQSSLSPCQIGIIQNNLNTCLRDRFVYKCSNCMPTIANFQLPETTCGSVTNIWLDGRATWGCHSFIIDIDQLDGNGTPIVGTHFTSAQYQSNSVGMRQLDALYTFMPRRRYRVKLTTSTNCGATSVKVGFFDTIYCPISNPNPPQRSAPAATSSSTSTPRPKL